MRMSQRPQAWGIVLICLVALGFFTIPAQVLHKHVRPAVANGRPHVSAQCPTISAWGAY